MTHSALPWYIEERLYGLCDIYDANDERVAECLTPTDAALIVHRVEIYDALVEAIKRTSAMLEREYLHFTKDTPEGKAILDLRAARELAKVQP